MPYVPPTDCAACAAKRFGFNGAIWCPTCDGSTFDELMSRMPRPPRVG